MYTRVYFYCVLLCYVHEQNIVGNIDRKKTGQLQGGKHSCFQRLYERLKTPEGQKEQRSPVSCGDFTHFILKNKTIYL
jgi:hypothetical protein